MPVPKGGGEREDGAGGRGTQRCTDEKGAAGKVQGSGSCALSAARAVYLFPPPTHTLIPSIKPCRGRLPCPCRGA